MQLKMFIVPVKNVAAAEAERNAFLRSRPHRFPWFEFPARVGAMAGLILGLVLAPRARAESHSADSNLTIVDTRGASITVAGRVLDAANRAPLNGVTASLAGQSTSSSASGQFSFGGVSLSSGNTLILSKSGYATHTGTVPAQAGSTTVTLPDILLQLVPPGNKPVVTGIQAKYDGIFLSGASLLNEYTASVNWNGGTPGSLEFYVNGTLRDTVATTTSEATASINMAQGFNPSLTAGGNKITAVAVSTDGTRSAAFVQLVGIVPVPSFLQSSLGSLSAFLDHNDPIISIEFQFPGSDIPSSALHSLPLLGKVGAEMAIGAGLEYAINTGEFQVHAGIAPYGRFARQGGQHADSGLLRPKLDLANVEFQFDVMARGSGRATLTRGFEWNDTLVEVTLHLEAEIMRFYLTDTIPGAQGVGVLLRSLESLGVDIGRIQQIRVIAFGEIGVELRPRFSPPPFHWGTNTLNVKAGIQAVYEPNLYIGHAKIYVGGSLESAFPFQPNFHHESTTLKAFLGAEVTWRTKILFKQEYPLVNYTWPSPDSAFAFPKGSNLPSETSGPMRRDYLQAGLERFVGNDLANFVTLKGGARMSALDAFRAIGQPLAQGAEAGKSSTSGLTPGNTSSFAQTDLPLMQNVFPYSDPAMAARGQELMLLYVADNGGSNTLQYTDIHWTRFDGTNWSAPEAIVVDTRGEFAAQVAFDGVGDAIAVWERVTTPNFTNEDIVAICAETEIVWSRWSRTNGAWTTPLTLTANGYLDHAPQLCGPMANGDVLLMWTKNEANLLMGIGPASSASNSVVMQSRWSAVSQTWDAPQVLVADLPYRLSQSLAGVSNLAVYAWTRDLDGLLTNSADQQVFHCVWSNGVWSAPTQFTTNSSGNRNVRVAVGADAHSYLMWQREADLVLSRDSSTNVTVVRADSQTAGFADYAMTIGPAGNLALLWQEMSEDGSDAHYSILDPASGTWSKDARLFEDAPLERSFAPVWDDVGNLTVAYNKVEILKTNKTVQLEGGGSVTITNVPEPGQVDLFVTKRRLIKDVAVAAGDFTVDAENYLPGAAVTLAATVRNVGDVAVSNAVASFYDGNPASGGTVITNVTVSGWLEGAATNLVSGLWVVPEPGTNHVLYVVVDPANAITEFNETNNTQSVSIGGTDLVVSLLSYAAETNGALRVIAQVQNLGAPSATNSMLAIRRAGNAGAPLATTEVPLLEPGRLAQVALDLPPGTQPEGEQLYVLRADETSLTSDVDTNNNVSSFAVNLWLDADSDGMADGFEGQYTFLNPNDPADSAFDYDGDGLSNLAEYRAGTNPEDPLSYLRIESLTVGGINGVQIAWGSSSNRLYAIQRADALVLGGGTFTNLAEHLLSTPPANVFLDITATNSSQFFYRVKVE